MQKFTAWMRRHRIILSILMVVVGFFAVVWCHYNAPININRMTYADWQDTHIKKIGAETIQKLEYYGPYESIQDIDKINGIGSVKVKQIERYFTVWDTTRSEAWWPIMIIGTALFFGGLLLLSKVEKTHREQNRTAEKLNQKLFKEDKIVKR